MCHMLQNSYSQVLSSVYRGVILQARTLLLHGPFEPSCSVPTRRMAPYGRCVRALKSHTPQCVSIVLPRTVTIPSHSTQPLASGLALAYTSRTDKYRSACLPCTRPLSRSTQSVLKAAKRECSSVVSLADLLRLSQSQTALFDSGAVQNRLPLIECSVIEVRHQA